MLDDPEIGGVAGIVCFPAFHYSNSSVKLLEEKKAVLAGGIFEAVHHVADDSVLQWKLQMALLESVDLGHPFVGIVKGFWQQREVFEVGIGEGRKEGRGEWALPASAKERRSSEWRLHLRSNSSTRRLMASGV